MHYEEFARLSDDAARERLVKVQENATITHNRLDIANQKPYIPDNLQLPAVFAAGRTERSM
jgi:hypothetical protein